MPFNSISQKNVNKNIELETAMNTVCFTIGEDVLHNKFCFYPSLVFSTVLVCNVSFLLLTFILKCSMPTLTFCFLTYFSPEIHIYLLNVTVFPV